MKISPEHSRLELILIGRLLTLEANIRLAQNILKGYKHSSLFGRDNKGESFMMPPSGANVIKLLTAVSYDFS